MSPEVISMEGQVGVGYRTRELGDIDGVGVHYTVTGPVADSIQQEKQHVKAIDDYHDTPEEDRDWKGIGYHFLLFDSGRIYDMGSLRCQRAGVASENRHLVHMAFVTRGIPSAAAQESGAWLLRYLWETYRSNWQVKGHRLWARPEFPTDCPGDEWRSWIPTMIDEANAEEGDMATDWERYTKALVSEKDYFDVVRQVARAIERQGELLPAVWRRSDADPPLDHEYVYKGLPAWCDELIVVVEALKKRATDRGF